jgi:hypothetical protein
MVRLRRRQCILPDVPQSPIALVVIAMAVIMAVVLLAWMVLAKRIVKPLLMFEAVTPPLEAAYIDLRKLCEDRRWSEILLALAINASSKEHRRDASKDVPLVHGQRAGRVERITNNLDVDDDYRDLLIADSRYRPVKVLVRHRSVINHAAFRAPVSHR